MSPRAALADRFAAARPRLLRLAYSQLGDLGEAEDVVQEAWLRLERAGAESVEDLDAWLTTVVGRRPRDARRAPPARPARDGGPGLPRPRVAPGAPAPPPP
ncbi:MAG: sigma factor, partial [Solirubrobacteraceae bacterium]